MTDDQPKKPGPKPRKAAQPKAATEAAAPSKRSLPASDPALGDAAGGDAAAAADAPSRPLNRHERRSAGKKRPGQPAFKWPPTGPDGR